MASREVVVNVCDLCHKDDGEGDLVVQTHTLVVDGVAVEAEVCVTCWWMAVKYIQPLVEVGRPAKGRRKQGVVVQHLPRKREAVEWPGSAWAFTSHALQRMGERRLKPMDVLAVADKPEIVRPGKQDDHVRVHEGRGLKVIVDTRDMVIVTAAGDEDHQEKIAI